VRRFRLVIGGRALQNEAGWIQLESTGMVSDMNIPGFTAEAALHQSQARWSYGTAVDDHRRQRNVRPQLRRGVPQATDRRGVGTIEDYWACKQACEATCSSCLNTCEGTWENPRGSTNCIICDQNYNVPGRLFPRYCMSVSLSGTRSIVDVIFSFTNRNTDFTEQFFVRTDITEEFPFLVTKLSPYFDR
jgi:hypothetical protein